MSQSRFRGVLPALITPFRDGAVDEDAFVRLVERQIAGGVHGLVPAGTTGESATLSHDEHRRVVELCVKTAAGRVPVIAGAGSNSTAEAIELTRHAKAVGADAVLMVTGYYNRPSQEGLFRHYAAVSAAVDMPVAGLQRARPHGGRRLQRDAGAGGEAGEHHRRQGRDRRRRAGQPAEAHCAAKTGCCCRAMIPPRSATWPTAATAASRSPPTSRRGRARPSSTPASPRDYERARTLQARLIRLHKALFLDASPAPTKFALAASRPLLGRGAPADRPLREAVKPRDPAPRWKTPASL